MTPRSIAVYYNASLSSAITAIGTDVVSLLIDEDVTLRANTTVPDNITLELANGKKIIANGYSLTFTGIGIQCVPTTQIFSGFTFDKLLWSNASPELYLEWFGGKADNSTDNASAFTLAVKLLSVSKANGRRGGVIRFVGGVYKFATAIDVSQSAYNIRFEGNGTKPVSFGSDTDTTLLFTGTGSGRAFDLRSCSGLYFNNIGVCYNSASFTGTLLDCSMIVSGPKAIQFTNCLLGSTFLPNSTPQVTAGCILNLSSAYDCQVSQCVIIGGLIGIRLNPTASPQDGNIITIEKNEFSHCLTAGIMNPHQQANIVNNNFEGTNTVSAVGGGLPYAISYDYPDPANAVIFGLKISGNWFGDRTTFGRAYIRLPRTKGADISGNFFGGGYNNATDFNSAAIEIYHGSTAHISGNCFGGGMHCVKFTLADGGNSIAFHGNSTQYAEAAEVNPNNGALGQKFFNSHVGDTLSTLGSN